MQRVRRALWHDGELPSRMPDAVENDPEEPLYRPRTSCSIQRLTIELRHGLRSIAHYYQPEGEESGLVIYHDGHCHRCSSTKDIDFFLSRGYAVMAFSMPMYGMNRVRGKGHSDLAKIEIDDPYVMNVFVEPVVVGLNYALAKRDYLQVIMIGLSGGGWTTNIVAAIDRRIDVSIPVAGGIPSDRDSEDFEQYAQRPIFEHVDYRDLYFLGATGSGRFQLQVLNDLDPCCFATIGRESSIREYETAIQNRIAEEKEGGSFEVWIDRSHRRHSTKTRQQVCSCS